MTGKREQPNKRSRLPVILAVIVACVLLAAVSSRFGTTPQQPPAEEVPPVEKVPVLPEENAAETEPVLEPEPLPEEPEEVLVAGIPGLPPLDAPIDPEKPMITSGVRIGTPAVTTRGMKEAEMLKIADFIDRAVKNKDNDEALAAIKEEVREFAHRFPMPQF